MNRNVESHFSMLPSANIDRSRFDRSQDVKFTFNVGELIPFYVDEVLPGDTFDVTTSKVVRLQTLLTPVMDNIYLDTYFFFVPNRLVWDHWQEFMGESPKAWLPEITYNVPKIGLVDDLVEGDGAVKVGDILDYMGVPTGVSQANAEGVVIDKFNSINALPLRAYTKIYNDWFRDTNLIDEVPLYTGDTNYKYNVSTLGQHKPYKAAKYHDYFTSGLPNRARLAGAGDPFQTGSIVSPVYGYNTQAIPVITGTANRAWKSGDTYPPLHGHQYDGTANANEYATFGSARNASDDGNTVVIGRIASGTNGGGFVPDNLYVDLSAHPMIGGIDIVSLRYAFQVQKFYEALARSGNRYISILKGLFGVDSPDQRLQRSEYLGGNRIPISIHQITNQSQGENDFLGDLGAMSLTTDKHGDFVKSFVEHGFVIGICVARYDHSYPQGLERFWFRRERFDYYFPQFANLSEMPIYVGEVYMDPTDLTTSNDTFAFQECWADYRYKPNKVMSEMRPGVSNTLDSWHFADYYTERPYLSQEWIEEDKANVDRTLAVTSLVANQIFCDIYIQNYSTRPMPMYSIPGLADHH